MQFRRSARVSRAGLGLVGLSLLAFPLGSCGSKTGLRVPDVSFDVEDAVDVQDVRDIVCVPERYEFLARGAEVMFVIDRSRSMLANLDGSDRPPSRWELFRDELSRSLLPVSDVLDFGALFFPSGQGPDPECDAASAVDVVPARGQIPAILSVFDTTDPSGGTPTASAIQNAADWFTAHPRRGFAQYIVLATDGGPNCNEELNYETCACTSRDENNQPNCYLGPDFVLNCLDDERTLAVVRDTAFRARIPVYVIGVEDLSRPDLQDVLDRMAAAGGRPNREPGERLYYSIRQEGDLAQAITTIRSAIVQCTYVLSRHADFPDQLRVTAGGESISRDPAHMNGWDLTNPTDDEVTFFGAACEYIQTHPPIIAEQGCEDAGPLDP